DLHCAGAKAVRLQCVVKAFRDGVAPAKFRDAQSIFAWAEVPFFFLWRRSSRDVLGLIAPIVVVGGRGSGATWSSGRRTTRRRFALGGDYAARRSGRGNGIDGAISADVAVQVIARVVVVP